MKKQLTPEQAWQDFLDNVFPSVEGRKSRLDVLRAISHQRRSLLGHKRIERILNDYAKGRYTFSKTITVTINEI